jgi:hypothetical protein
MPSIPATCGVKVALGRVERVFFDTFCLTDNCLPDFSNRL